VTVLPQLRAEVVAAVAAPRRRRRVPLTPVFAVAVVAVTVAIVLLALPSDKTTEVPVTDPSMPPSSQLARYGVLRRAATPADREALQTLYGQMSPEDIVDLREDYVRGVAPNLILYSMPYAVGNAGILTGDSRADPLCLYAVSQAWDCWSAAQLERGESFPAGTHRFGLVPDGVASVTLRADDGRDYSGKVRDNVFDVEVPKRNGVIQDVRGVTWRDARGEFAGP
jgi:hypothetical protein